MPAALRVPKSQWVASASHALVDQGHAGVRVETLAAAIGVTKGSFYNHFASRGELLEAVLEDWERRSTDDVLMRVEAIASAPTEKIRLAGLLTFDEELRRIDLAIREWARTDAGVRARLRRVDDARMDYLRTQFRHLVHDPDEVEARSVLAFTFAIGRHFLADSLGDTMSRKVSRRVGSLLGLTGENPVSRADSVSIPE